MSWKIY